MDAIAKFSQDELMQGQTKRKHALTVELPRYFARYWCIPSEEFELTAISLGAHMKVNESSPGMVTVSSF